MSAPAGALAHLDFTTGDYSVGGVAQAITALLGGGFDPGAISSEGIRFDEVAGGNKPTIIGPLLPLVLGNYIAKIEFKDDGSSGGNHNLLVAYDAPNRDGGGTECYYWAGGGEIYGGADCYNTMGSGNADEGVAAGAPGDVITSVFVHDVGLVAVSSQGHLVVPGAHSMAIPARTVAYLGHVGEGATGAMNGWIRKLTIFPALTAL